MCLATLHTPDVDRRYIRNRVVCIPEFDFIAYIEREVIKQVSLVLPIGRLLHDEDPAVLFTEVRQADILVYEIPCIRLPNISCSVVFQIIDEHPVVLPAFNDGVAIDPEFLVSAQLCWVVHFPDLPILEEWFILDGLTVVRIPLILSWVNALNTIVIDIPSLGLSSAHLLYGEEVAVRFLCVENKERGFVTLA